MRTITTTGAHVVRDVVLLFSEKHLGVKVVKCLDVRDCLRGLDWHDDQCDLFNDYSYAPSISL